uniref:Genome polyprotein n=1 Tax=Cyclopterus lumpus virus TaxID=2055848 RepID=A0A2H4QUF3_9FLAV|nr:polyprotein [Cyclopterus lumpus virus]
MSYRGIMRLAGTPFRVARRVTQGFGGTKRAIHHARQSAGRGLRHVQRGRGKIQQTFEILLKRAAVILRRIWNKPPQIPKNINGVRRLRKMITNLNSVQQAIKGPTKRKKKSSGTGTAGLLTLLMIFFATQVIPGGTSTSPTPSPTTPTDISPMVIACVRKDKTSSMDLLLVNEEGLFAKMDNTKDPELFIRNNQTYGIDLTECSTGFQPDTNYSSPELKYDEHDCALIRAGVLPTAADTCFGTTSLRQRHIHSTLYQDLSRKTRNRRDLSRDTIQKYEIHTNQPSEGWMKTLSTWETKVLSNTDITIALLALVMAYFKVPTVHLLLIILFSKVYLGVADSTSSTTEMSGKTLCSDPEEMSTMTGVAHTSVSLRMDYKHCYQIQPVGMDTITARMSYPYIDNALTGYKISWLDISSNSVSSDRCPGDGEPACPKSGPYSICARGYHDRGWTTGCFLFGQGPVCTCAELTLKHPIQVYTIDPTKMGARLTVSFGRTENQNYYNMDTNTGSFDITDKADSSSRVRVTCQLPHAELATKYLIKMAPNDGESYLVDRLAFESMKLPWSVWTTSIPTSLSKIEDGNVHDAETYITWRDTTLHYVRFSEAHNVESMVKNFLDKNGKIIIAEMAKGSGRASPGTKMPLDISPTDCSFMLNSLKIHTTSVKDCADTTNYAFKLIEGSRILTTHDGVVTFNLDMAVPSQCRLVVKGRSRSQVGSGYTSNYCTLFDQAHIVTSTKEVLKMHCPPGEHEIKLGNNKYQVNVPQMGITGWLSRWTTNVLEVKDRITIDGAVKRPVLDMFKNFFAKGAGFLGSLFGMTSTIMMAVTGGAIVWLGTLMTGNMKNLTVIIGLILMAPLVITEVEAEKYGCVADTDEWSMECGSIKDVMFDSSIKLYVPQLGDSYNIDLDLMDGLTILRMPNREQIQKAAKALGSVLHKVYTDEGEECVTDGTDHDVNDTTSWDQTSRKLKDDGKQGALITCHNSEKHCKNCREIFLEVNEVDDVDGWMYDTKELETTTSTPPVYYKGEERPESYLKDLTVDCRRAGKHYKCSAHGVTWFGTIHTDEEKEYCLTHKVEGTVTQIFGAKRRSWRSCGISCSSLCERVNTTTKGHIWPKRFGGPECNFNCWPITKKQNEEDEKKEMSAAENAYRGGIILRKEASERLLKRSLYKDRALTFNSTWCKQKKCNTTVIKANDGDEEIDEGFTPVDKEEEHDHDEDFISGKTSLATAMQENGHNQATIDAATGFYKMQRATGTKAVNQLINELVKASGGERTASNDNFINSPATLKSEMELLSYSPTRIEKALRSYKKGTEAKGTKQIRNLIRELLTDGEQPLTNGASELTTTATVVLGFSLASFAFEPATEAFEWLLKTFLTLTTLIFNHGFRVRPVGAKTQITIFATALLHHLTPLSMEPISQFGWYAVQTAIDSPTRFIISLLITLEVILIFMFPKPIYNMTRWYWSSYKKESIMQMVAGGAICLALAQAPKNLSYILFPVAALYILMRRGATVRTRHLTSQLLAPIDKDDDPPTGVGTITLKEGKLQYDMSSLHDHRVVTDSTRVFVVVLIAIFGLLDYRAGIAALILAFGYFKNAKADLFDTFNIAGPERVEKDTFSGPEGIYEVYNRTPLGDEHLGYGYNKNNIFHTMYHITKGLPLEFEDEVTTPYDYSDELDWITYGGPWAFAKREGRDLFVYLHREHRLRPLKISSEDDKVSLGTTRTIAFGDSGSPVLARDADGTLTPVSLAGHTVPLQDPTYEAMILPTPTTGMDLSKFQRKFDTRGPGWNPIVLRCGAGKTRHVLRRAVVRSTETGRNCLLLAPTRTVAGEMYEALKDLDVGIDITGKVERRNKRNLIMCHSTAVNRLLHHSLNIHNYKNIFVDEAHMQDPMTIALLGFLEERTRDTSNDIQVFPMTATWWDHYETETNFPVIDTKLNDEKMIVDAIKDSLSKNRRSITFVPTIKKAEELYTSVGEGERIILNRYTYRSEISKIKTDKDKPIAIFATNIAEVGLNANLDDVFDLQQQIVFKESVAGVITRETSGASKASTTQRRGRVGRVRSGTYQYLDQAATHNIMHDSDIIRKEAAIVLKMLGVDSESTRFCQLPQIPPISLSKKKGIMRLTNDNDNITIYLAHYVTDDSGIEVDWTTGVHPCSCNDCKTANNKFMIVDPRSHSYMMHKQNGEPLIKGDTRIYELRGSSTITGSILRYIKASANPTSRLMMSVFAVEVDWTWADPYVTSFNQGYIAIIKQLPIWIGVHLKIERVAAAILWLLIWKIITYIFGGRSNDSKVVINNGNMSSLPGLAILATGIALHFVDKFNSGHLPVALVSVGCIYILGVLYYSQRQVSYKTTASEAAFYLFAVFATLVGLFIYILRSHRDVFDDFTSPRKRYYHTEEDKKEHEPITEAPPLSISKGFTFFLGLVPLINLLAETMTQSKGLQNMNVNTLRHSLSGGAEVKPPVLITIFTVFAMFQGSSLTDCIVTLCLSVLYYLFYFGHSAHVNTKSAVTASPGNTTGDSLGFSNAPLKEDGVIKVFTGLVLLTDALLRQEMTVALALNAFFTLIPLFLSKGEEPSYAFYMILQAGLEQELLLVIGSVATALFCRSISRTRKTGGAVLSMSFNSVVGRHKNLEPGFQDYKTRMNGLSKNTFYNLRKHMVPIHDKGTVCSRGYHKMNELLRYHDLEISGKILELGCGSGGFTQRMVLEKKVDRIDAISWGPDKKDHNLFELFKKSTPGHGKVRYSVGEAFTNRDFENYDWVVMDIGEQSPDMARERTRDLWRLDWITKKVIPHAKVIMKILSPTDIDVLRAIPPGYKIVRLYHSWNSNFEMYMIPGDPSDNITRMNQLLKNLNIRLQQTLEGEHVELEAEQVKLPSVVEKIGTNLGREYEDWCLAERLEQLPALTQVERPKLDHFQYLASFFTEARKLPGTCSNPIIMTFWNGLTKLIPGAGGFTMTDTTHDGSYKMFQKKMDNPPSTDQTYIPELHRVFDKMSDFLFKRNKPRRLTREEIIQIVRNDAAVGNIHPDIIWPTALEALESESFWKVVEEETHLHSQGKCRYGIFNTMGKREKKDTDGERSGSRIICYLPLVERVIEMDVLGFLNKDHIAGPESLPCGVSGVSPYHYPDIFSKKAGLDPETGDMTKAVIQDDTAAWDTRVRKDVLHMERDFILKHTTDPYHANLIKTQYKIYGEPILTITRPFTVDRSVVDVLQGYGQRCSGTVVTYAMNTITNACVQTLRFWEAMDVDLEEVLNDMPHILNSMMISGDDMLFMVEPWLAKKLSSSLKVINSLGFPRKGLTTWQESPIITQFDKVYFCSHKFTIARVAGERRAFLDKDLFEIIGKTQLVLGGLHSPHEIAGHAKSVAIYMFVTFFHNRAVRKVALAILSALPDELVPMGNVANPFFLDHSWISNEDLITIFNNVHGTHARSYTDIGYTYKTLAKIRGDPLDHEERTTWNKDLKRKIESISTHYNSGITNGSFWHEQLRTNVSYHSLF